MSLLNKTLRTLGYKTHSGRWDFKEIRFDLAVYTALGVCVALAVMYG